MEVGGTHICLRYSSTSSRMYTATCSGTDSGQYWQLTNGTIKSPNNTCLGLGSGSVAGYSNVTNVSVGTCVAGAPSQKWETPGWSGGDKSSLYSYSAYSNGLGRKLCLVDPNNANNQTVGVVGCDTSAQNYTDQHFTNVTLPTSGSPLPSPPTAPPVVPPKAPPAPNLNSNCVKNTYQLGSSGTTCIKTIQDILTATYNYYHVSHAGTKVYTGLPVSVDGVFGTSTQTEVKAFQNYFIGKSGADGIVGSNTWQYMCSVAYYHDTNSDYKVAGCTAP